ncbi:MAG TPA: hypothetical protein VIF83_11315, partial [Gemmatimonadaceae bacterium]
MRRQIAWFLVVAVFGCVDANRPTNTEPSVATVQNAPDLDGLPDLIVDSKATQNNWVTRVEDFP